MIRFIHTADVQLGMPFAWAEGEAGLVLRRARLECLERIARLAREQSVHFVLVAGDLFDDNAVEDRVVIQACERLRAFEVPVLVIPGNHDFGGTPRSVFRRRVFRENKPGTVQVIESRQPVVLPGLDTVILPAPLLRRHEAGDTTTHITATLGSDLVRDGHRVGLAHGGVLRFDGGEGEATNFIDPDRAETARLDYLALGDWHRMRRINPRTWYSGTPEPTEFDQEGAGKVLLVEVPAPGVQPTVEPVPVAVLNWVRYRTQLTGGSDVERLARFFEELPDPSRTLVECELAGTLPLADLERLERVLERAAGRFVLLRRSGPGVLPRPSDDEIDAIATDGYLRLALERLREKAAGEDPDAAPAAQAIQLLYRFSREEDQGR